MTSPTGTPPPAGPGPLGAAAFLAAVCFASFAAPDALWGLASPAAYGAPAVAALLLAAALAALPAADRALERVLTAAASRRERTVVVLVALALVPLSWVFRVRVPWLGDQVLWARSIGSEKDVGHLLEPLSFRIAWLARGWMGPDSLGLVQGPAFLSCLLAFPFTIAAWLLAKRLAPRHGAAQLWIWLLALGAPITLVFRGYVESYGLLLIALVLAAWLALAPRGTLPYAGAWAAFAAAASFHLQGLAAAPALLIRARSRGRLVLAAAALAAAAIGTAAWLRIGGRLYAAQEKSAEETFLFLGGPGGGAAFLGATHLLGALNVLLLAGGPLLWTLPGAVARRGWRGGGIAVAPLAFLAAAGVGGLLGVRLSLGAIRDWDLFGAWLFFLIPLAAHFWTAGGIRLPRFSALLLVLAVGHGLAWTLLDVRVDRAFARAERLYGPGARVAPDAIALTADEMAFLERGRGDHGKSAVWYGRAAEANPGNWRFFNNQGAELLRVKRAAEAESAFAAAAERSPRVADPHANLGAVRLERGEFAGALAAFTRGGALVGPEPRLLLGRGIALQGLGRPGEAYAALDSAIARGFREPPVLRAAIQAAVASGNTRAALARLRELAAAVPGDAGVWAELAALAAAAGDSATARAAGAEARRLGAAPAKDPEPRR